MLGVLYSIPVRDFNRIIGAENSGSVSVRGLDEAGGGGEGPLEEAIIPPEILELAQRRFDFKKRKMFAEADAIRIELSLHGYEVLDTKDGFTVKRK